MSTSSGTGPEEDGSLERFRQHVRETLASRLAPRALDAPARLYGIRDGEAELERGRTFLQLMSDLGWATPSWPVEHGGAGLSPAQAATLAQEFQAFDVPDLYPYDVSLRMVASVMFRHGTVDQRERWLAPIRLGAEIWCQLFSEPDAGSDLGAVACRAEPAGQDWLINGRKTWTSRASYAKWGLLLCRSDPDTEKHRGLTAFALDMTTPGVTVTPIRQMNGDEHFAEILLEDVRIPDSHRLGEVGGGWQTAMTTLANERAGFRVAGLGLGPRHVLQLLTVRPLDAALRERVLDVFIELELSRLTSARAAAAMIRGATPGPEGSGSKLRNAAALQRLAEVALEVLGPEAMVDDSFWSALALTVPSISIRGGTNQVQKNIIGERVLGLPREPSVERGVTFAELRRRQHDGG